MTCRSGGEAVGGISGAGGASSGGLGLKGMGMVFDNTNHVGMISAECTGGTGCFGNGYYPMEFDGNGYHWYQAGTSTQTMGLAEEPTGIK